MGRKKNSTSETDVSEKMSAPLTQRLNELITDSNELKDFLGCSIQAVNQYKLGISRPSLENLSKIADFYGVSTDYLLGRTDIKTANADKRTMCEYSGLTESALEYLHSLLDNPDYLRMINAILSDKTFQAVLPEIPNLEKVKIAVDLDRFGVLSPVEERWTKDGYLVGAYDYFDMLEFRIAQELKIVISNITNPPIDEER